MYNTISQYVTKVVNAQFSENSIKEDKLLKAYFNYCAAPQYGDLTAFPKTPETIEQVAEVFTKIIW